MSPTYKPHNYSTVSPYLIVDGARATIDFLKRVFGAVELRQFPDAAGRLMHAEVRIDDTVVMIADGGGGWPPVPSYVHVYVSDVDATYRRAKPERHQCRNRCRRKTRTSAEVSRTREARPGGSPPRWRRRPGG